MNADLDIVDGRPVLRFERELAHPPQKVWHAVTDPGEMSHWFPAAVSTELRIGARMRFDFGEPLAGEAAAGGVEGPDGAPYADGEILELDPPRVYAFRWTDEHYRLELFPRDAGCLLVFTVTLSGTGTVGDLPSVARNAPGWDGCLDALTARLDGQPVPQPTPAWFLAHAEHYVDRFGLGEGTATTTADGYLLRFERDLIQSVPQVWSCLTGDAGPGTERVPGSCTHEHLEAGAITAVEPPHALAYGWCHDGVPVGTVRFALREQEPIGCRLVLTQTVPAGLGGLCATALAAWQTHLEVLFATLNGATRSPAEGRTAALAAGYARRLTGLQPTGPTGD